MFRPPPLIATAAFLILSFALCATVWYQARKDGYQALAEWADARLSQHNDRLLGQVARYQQLVNTVARHPHVMDASRGEPASPGLSEALTAFALKTGASGLFVIDTSGRLVAGSETAQDPPDLRQGDQRRHAFIRTALQGGLGWAHGLEDDGRARMIYVARAIFAEDGPVVGAVAAAVAVRTLELEWSFSPEPVAFFDQAGIAFITNRPDIALRRNRSLSGAGDPLKTGAPGEALPAFYDYRETERFGYRIWETDDKAELPGSSLVLERFLPRVQLTAVIFQDTRPTEERALILTSLAAVSLALIGVLLWVAYMRRLALARQLQLEAAANEQLEARVAARTDELRDTQRQLIAAGRLSALGEMAAGISHELNQPLAAIRTFAENGKTFLKRGKPEKAGENFDAQIQQVDRIGRIIRSLRAFARNEEQEIAVVDLAQIVEAAIGVSDLRLRREGVRVRRKGLGDPVPVRGGQVRLQQVVVNILGNAIDAMDGAERKEISVAISRAGDETRLVISDTGPGIARPDKVFDPFYSTKDPGGSSGMGLGMSISHGLVGSFGGTLTCQNRPEGGAEFVVTLPSVREGLQGDAA